MSLGRAPLEQLDVGEAVGAVQHHAQLPDQLDQRLGDLQDAGGLAGVHQNSPRRVPHVRVASQLQGGIGIIQQNGYQMQSNVFFCL